LNSFGKNVWQNRSCKRGIGEEPVEAIFFPSEVYYKNGFSFVPEVIKLVLKPYQRA
jgi:hypothetical protein